MNCTRPLLALTVGGALWASLAVAAQPALAASAAPSSASTPATGDADSSSTDDITVSRGGSTILLTVTAPTGTVVTVAGADGRALAGSTSRAGSARVAVAAPRITTTLTVTASTGTIGTVTLAGSSASKLVAPAIVDSVNDGKRGAITVTGMPGAVVAIRDQGKLIGTRMVGSSGTVSVPIPGATDVDYTLSVTQSLEGLVSEAKQMDWLAAPRVEIGRVTPDAAVITFVTPYGTKWPFSLTDENGAEVDSGRFDAGGVTHHVVNFTPGQSTTFTVTRGGPVYAASARTAFTIDASKADATPLTEAAIKFPAGLIWPFIAGLPAASFAIHEGDAHGPVVIEDVFDTKGTVVDTSRKLKPSTQYVIVQSIGSTTSAPFEFTTPAF